MSQTNSDYYAYGQYTYNLYDQTGQADWGYNAISNGGNTTNTWRTPTHEEWSYVFNERSTPSGIRYAKANVNNINGVILLPDDWSSNYYTLSATNQGYASFASNTITVSQWNTLEQHGAVFLPVAGYRDGTSVSYVGSGGGYWLAICLMAGIRKKLEGADIPKPLRGVGIAVIITGLIAMAFSGFSGISFN